MKQAKVRIKGCFSRKSDRKPKQDQWIATSGLLKYHCTIVSS